MDQPLEKPKHPRGSRKQHQEERATFRAVRRIYDQFYSALRRLPQTQSDIDRDRMYQTSLDIRQVLSTVRKYEAAVAAGRLTLANYYRNSILSVTDNATYRLNQVSNRLRQERQLGITSSTSSYVLRNLFDDIFCLKNDFDDVQVYAAEENEVIVVSAVTQDFVVVDGKDIEIDFGKMRIEIRFRVKNNHARKIYPDSSDITVVPAEGRGYRSNEDSAYYHPHVAPDGCVCFGEGANAIDAALKQGRILDVFSITSCVLHTYGFSSPYVKLETWLDDYDQSDEQTCDNCDREDANLCSGCERSSCDQCDRACAADGCKTPSICAMCQRICGSCEQSYCASHEPKNVCQVCDEPTCDACVKEAATCGTCNNAVDETVCEHCSSKQVCSSCEEPLCSECREKLDAAVCSKCRVPPASEPAAITNLQEETVSCLGERSEIEAEV